MAHVPAVVASHWLACQVGQRLLEYLSDKGPLLMLQGGDLIAPLAHLHGQLPVLVFQPFNLPLKQSNPLALCLAGVGCRFGDLQVHVGGEV